MQVIWAPWRMRYIEGGRSDRCIFCIDPAAPPQDLILAVDDGGVVMMNRFPYNNGHLLIAPRRHVARLSDLRAGEYAALMECVRGSIEILERELKPQGFNVGINIGATAGAGITDHLHWHAVPRWDGDTNYMPVIGEVKVLPQHLQDGYERLRPYFQGWLARRGE